MDVVANFVPQSTALQEDLAEAASMLSDLYSTGQLPASIPDRMIYSLGCTFMLCQLLVVLLLPKGRKLVWDVFETVTATLLALLLVACILGLPFGESWRPAPCSGAGGGGGGGAGGPPPRVPRGGGWGSGGGGGGGGGGAPHHSRLRWPTPARGGPQVLGDGWLHPFLTLRPGRRGAWLGRRWCAAAAGPHGARCAPPAPPTRLWQ